MTLPMTLGDPKPRKSGFREVMGGHKYFGAHNSIKLHI